MSTPTETDCYCTAARKAARKLSRFYDAFLADAGLTVAQYSILAEIDRRSAEPPTMKTLAAVLIMDRSTLGQNLKPLGPLLAVTPDRDDARSKRVRLSAHGQKAFEYARELWKIAQVEYAKSVGNATADRARRMMNAVASSSQF